MLKVVVQKPELKSDRKWSVEEMEVRSCKESFMLVSTWQITRLRCSVACERITCDVSESAEKLMSCKNLTCVHC